MRKRCFSLVKDLSPIVASALAIAAVSIPAGYSAIAAIAAPEALHVLGFQVGTWSFGIFEACGYEVVRFGPYFWWLSNSTFRVATYLPCFPGALIALGGILLGTRIYRHLIGKEQREQ